MMDGPHIFGFSPLDFCINLTSALASARLVASVRASINAGTLNLVGLVLFSAISRPPFLPQVSLTWGKARAPQMPIAASVWPHTAQPQSPASAILLVVSISPQRRPAELPVDHPLPSPRPRVHSKHRATRLECSPPASGKRRTPS